MDPKILHIVLIVLIVILLLYITYVFIIRVVYDSDNKDLIYGNWETRTIKEDISISIQEKISTIVIIDTKTGCKNVYSGEYKLRVKHRIIKLLTGINPNWEYVLIPQTDNVEKIYLQYTENGFLSVFDNEKVLIATCRKTF